MPSTLKRRSRTDRKIGMTAPKINRHRDRREQITDQNQRPSQDAENRFGENKRHGDEAKLENHEEQQNAKAQMQIALCQSEQPRCQATDQAKYHAVHPGVDEDHLQRNGLRRRWLDASAAAKERHAQNVGREERTTVDQIDDEKPQRDGGRADQARDQSLLISLRNLRRR